MILTGYYILSPNCPSFVLPIFVDTIGGENPSELYIQKIDYSRNEIVGFEVLQDCKFAEYNSDQILIKNLHDSPLYAAQLSETEIFIGETESFKERIDTLDANCFPNEFKIQLYNLVGESGLEKNARRNFVKTLDESRGRKYSESYIQSSVSMSGWEKTEEMLLDSDLCKTFIENFKDIEFMVLENKIVVNNKSSIKELENLDLSSVIESLEREYLDILNLVNNDIPSNIDIEKRFDDPISPSDEFDFDFFRKFVRAFGRQEERLSIVLLSCLVFPSSIPKIFLYRDYARTATHGLLCLKENYQRFSDRGAHKELGKIVWETIEDVYLDWQSGDRMYFAAYLTKWFYPHQQFYRLLIGHALPDNIRYQEFLTNRMSDTVLKELVDLPTAMARYSNHGSNFIYQYCREVDWPVFHI